MQYLALRRLAYSNLKESFRLNAFFVRFRRLSQGRLTHREQIALLCEVLESGGQRFSSVNEDILSTRSNLNSSVLRDICCVLSLDMSHFDNDLDFLDKVLLHRRNNIAHGDFIEIDFEVLRDMSDRVIELMRKFNNLVDNQVSLQGYRAPTALDYAQSLITSI